MRRPISSAVLVAGLLALIGASVANAQFSWTGTVSNDPTVGGNWFGGTAPVGTSGTESLTFGNVSPSPQYVQIPAPVFAVLNLNFTGSATTYYFSGTSVPTLALYGDVIAATDSFAKLDNSVNIGLTAGNHTINVDSGGSLEADGVIGEISGSSTLIKTGIGDVTLGGANTFTGGVIVNGGTLFLNNSSTVIGSVVTAGPVGTGTLTLKDQTTLAVGPSSNTILGNAVALDSGGGNVTVDTSNWNLNLNGTISGSAGLTVVGGDILTVTGNNTFTGGVTVKDGSELDLGNSTKDGSGNVTFFAGSIQSGPVGTGTLTLQDGATLSTASNGDIILANNILLPGTGNKVSIDLSNSHYDSVSDGSCPTA